MADEIIKFPDPVIVDFDGWVIHESPTFKIYGSIKREDYLDENGIRNAKFSLQDTYLEFGGGASMFNESWQMMIVISKNEFDIIDASDSNGNINADFDTFMANNSAKYFYLFNPGSNDPGDSYDGVPCTWYLPCSYDGSTFESGESDGPSRKRIQKFPSAENIYPLIFTGDDVADSMNIMIFTRCQFTYDGSSGCTILVTGDDHYHSGQSGIDGFIDVPYMRVKYNNTTTTPDIVIEPEKDDINFKSLVATTQFESGRGIRFDVTWLTYKPTDFDLNYPDENGNYHPNLVIRLLKDNNIIDVTRNIKLVPSQSGRGANNLPTSPGAIYLINNTTGATTEWNSNNPDTNLDRSDVSSEPQWNPTAREEAYGFNIYNNTCANEFSDDGMEKFSAFIYYTGLDMGSTYTLQVALYRGTGGFRLPFNNDEWVTTTGQTYGTNISGLSATETSIEFKCDLTRPTKTAWGNNVYYRYAKRNQVFPDKYPTANKPSDIQSCSDWMMASDNNYISITGLDSEAFYAIQCIAVNSDGSFVNAVTGKITDMLNGNIGISNIYNDTQSTAVLQTSEEYVPPTDPGGGNVSGGNNHHINVQLKILSLDLEASAQTIKCVIKYRYIFGSNHDDGFSLNNSNNEDSIQVRCQGGSINKSKYCKLEFNDSNRNAEYTITTGFTGLNKGTRYTITIGGNKIRFKAPSYCSCFTNDLTKYMTISSYSNIINTRKLILSVMNTTSRCVQIRGESYAYPDDRILISIQNKGSITINSGSNTGDYFNKLVHNTSYTVTGEIVDCFAFTENGSETRTNDSIESISIRTKRLKIILVDYSTYQHAIECICKMTVDGADTSIDAICKEKFSIVNSEEEYVCSPYAVQNYLDNQIIKRNINDGYMELATDYYNYSTHRATVRYKKLSNYYCWYKIVITGTDGYNKVSTDIITINTEFPYIWIYSNGSWKRYMSYVHDGSKYVPAPVFVHNDGRYIEANGNRPADETSDGWIKYSRNDRTNYPD